MSIVGATFLLEFTYRPFLSVNHRGDAVHGAPVVARCRYQPSTRLVRAEDGSQVVEQAILFTKAAVTEKDLVWPPGVAVPEDAEDPTGSLRPLAVHARRLLFSTAVDHYEVHL